MSLRENEQTEKYSEYLIQLITAQIIKDGGITKGVLCPNCQEGTFDRCLEYIEFNPLESKVAGAIYMMVCNMCGIKVKDIWETKEVWELTTEAIPK